MKRGPTIGSMHKNSLASRLEALKVGEYLYLFGVKQGYSQAIVSQRNKAIKRKGSLKVKAEQLLLTSPKTLKTEIVYKITKL